MADWDAAQYLKFKDERTRPVFDLLARVRNEAPRRCVDLGCGPGNSTAVLRQTFPDAEITGLDSSPDMLAKARADLPDIPFVQADLATWVPAAPCDVMLSNAVLQWLPDHAALLGRLVGGLASGGSLAVQMPDNLAEPSHSLMREVASTGPWASRFPAAGEVRTRIATFDSYYTWLRDAGCSVDLWRTTYVHPLPGVPAIVEWLKSTGLRPYIDALDETDRAAFLDTYAEKLGPAYPTQPDGTVCCASRACSSSHAAPRSRTAGARGHKDSGIGVDPPAAIFRE